MNRHAGSYVYTLTVRDPFGATASDDVRMTFLSPGSTNDVVLYAADAAIVAGSWRVAADPSAAGGRKMYQPDTAAAKVVTASASPANYFELSFDAEAGRPYHLWIRGKADWNTYSNDSVHVQFSDSVLSGGQPIWRIGSTSSTEWNLEECPNCGEAGWGWEDNGWGGLDQLGQPCSSRAAVATQYASSSVKMAWPSIRSSSRPPATNRRGRAWRRTTPPSCRGNSPAGAGSAARHPAHACPWPAD